MPDSPLLVPVSCLAFCDHAAGCDYPADFALEHDANGYPVEGRCEAHVHDVAGTSS